MNTEAPALSDALRHWCEAHGAQPDAVRLTAIRGGGSCEMFRCDIGGDSWVLRRAPLTSVSDTAHDVIREYQIIDALQDRGARVPKLIGFCDDRSVFGAPFFAMRFIDGEVIRRGLPEHYLRAPEHQASIGKELIDALVELHSVPWQETSLVDLAKPKAFLERQVKRWLDQLDGYLQRDLPGVVELSEWLERHRPTGGDLTVMHGDYKLDNAMFSRDLPPRILSLVDFEMTTIGDPLIDLAWGMIFWPEEGNLIAIASPGSPNGMSPGHYQTPAQLLERYATQTGRDLSAFDWYAVFAAWKLAIVLEGSYAKFLTGESKNPNHEFFGFLIEQLLARATRLAA